MYIWPYTSCSEILSGYSCKKEHDVLNFCLYKLQAKDYLNEGKHREAIECFQRAIDVTPAMARDLIQACRERNIDCIVAPYEGKVRQVV